VTAAAKALVTKQLEVRRKNKNKNKTSTKTTTLLTSSALN